MNVTIDMDQELSKRIVAQTRNGQHYIFSLNRLKHLTGMEQLTSLTVMTGPGDETRYNLPTDFLPMARLLLQKANIGECPVGVRFHFQSSDLKERVVSLILPEEEMVDLNFANLSCGIPQIYLSLVKVKDVIAWY
jgi:hypothetical protein